MVTDDWMFNIGRSGPFLVAASSSTASAPAQTPTDPYSSRESPVSEDELDGTAFAHTQPASCRPTQSSYIPGLLSAEESPPGGATSEQQSRSINVSLPATQPSTTLGSPQDPAWMCLEPGLEHRSPAGGSCIAEPLSSASELHTGCPSNLTDQATSQLPLSPEQLHELCSKASADALSLSLEQDLPLECSPSKPEASAASPSPVPDEGSADGLQSRSSVSGLDEEIEQSPSSSDQASRALSGDPDNTDTRFVHCALNPGLATSTPASASQPDAMQKGEEPATTGTDHHLSDEPGVVAHLQRDAG